MFISPNNGFNQSWSCLANAKMGGKLLQAGADAVGALPVAGTVANVAQLTVEIVATTASAANGDRGAASLGYGTAALTVIGRGFFRSSKLIPVFGNVVSAYQFGTDLFGKNGVMQTYSNCLGN